MNVLVTGGTGFVGREVVRQLATAGHQAFLLARHPRSPKTETVTKPNAAQIRVGDILNPKSLPEACVGMDAVIHLVGIINEVGNQTFENVHTRGTENVVRAAQQAGVKRFIHMSALGTRPNATARYHQSKWAAEEIVRGSGLDWTIFRPSVIYGRGDGFVNLFAKIARRSPIVPIIGSGESKLQPIAVENVGKAFVAALNEPRSISQTFTLTGPEVFTFNQIVDEILMASQLKRGKLHLPVPVAIVQATLLEILFGKVLRKAPPLNRDQVLMAQEDNAGDGKPADERFALQHEHFRAGIERYVKPAS